nr:MAG TPA: hypothetical protein [Caudoviricetes sp.]
MSVNSSGITYVLESGGDDYSSAMEKKLIEIAASMGKRVPDMTEEDYILYMISINEASKL